MAKDVQEAKRLGSIWYATKSDPMLAVEPVIWFRTPDGVAAVLEPVGWKGGRPESAVHAVLRAAGCVPGAPRTLGIRVWEDDATCVRHVGFDVAADRWDDAFASLKLLSGAIGGWTDVLVGQAAFHAPTHFVQILTLIWDRAGRPQWRSANSLSSKPAKGGGEPLELPPFAAGDKRARFAFSRFFGLEDGGSDFITLQKTHMEVQEPVEVAAERCEICGGRLYEADGHFFCASAATLESKPDFEDS